MVRAIMHGCNGRMGQMITGIVAADADIEIVAGIDVSDHITNTYPVFKSIDECDVQADVIIDFANAAAVDGLLEYSVNKQVPVVLCTTGLSDEQLNKMKEASAKVIAFAERLYTTCLGREAEKEGLEWWAAELANLRQTGTVAASGFFYSPEFLGLNTSDDEYVTRLYRTFMGREPEEAGFEFWTSELKSGKDRQYVFDGFSAAPEFADLCADAGIMR